MPSVPLHTSCALSSRVPSRLLRHLPLILALWAVACRPLPEREQPSGCFEVEVDPLSELVVQSARLEEVGFWQAGLLGGAYDGDALLVVELDAANGIDAEPLELDVMLQGGVFGVVAEAGYVVAPGAVELVDAAGQSVRALLGTYRGSQTGGALGLSGHLRFLENDAGVSMTLGTLGVGLGLTPAVFNQLELRLYDDPRRYETAPLFSFNDDDDGFDDDVDDDFDDDFDDGFDDGFDDDPGER